MEGITLNKICAYLGADSDDLSTAMAHVLQSIINSISGLERLKADREKHEAERKADVNNKARPYLFLSEKIGENKTFILHTEYAVQIKYDLKFKIVKQKYTQEF